MQKKFFSFILILLFLVAAYGLGSENIPVTKANYELPARFTRKQLKKMVFTARVDPHWLKHSDRFWYTYETSDGKTFSIVDPAKRQRQQLFDNVKMAAELSKLTKDPYEAKHIPIEGIEFIKNDRFIYFKVEKSEEVLETQRKKLGIERRKKREDMTDEEREEEDRKRRQRRAAENSRRDERDY